MFKRILVPLDGSRRAEEVLPAAAQLARAGNATLILVRATGRSPFQTPLREPSQVFLERSEALRAHEEAYLTEVRERELFAGVPVEVSAMIGPAAEVIVESVETTGADLIVMCSHGRSGATRWALGSVAQQVTRHASIPVLVFRGGHPMPVQANEHGTMRVLIGLDGSAMAEATVLPAVALVRALSAPSNGELHLMQVVVPWIAATADSAPNADGGTLDAAVADASAYLQDLIPRIRARVPDGNGLTLTWSVVVDTDIAQALLATAGDGATRGVAGTVSGESGAQPYDLIALATHGRTGLRRWAIGSITERVLHAAQCPLLIVRVPDSRREDSPFDEPSLDEPALTEEVERWPDAN